MHTRVRMHFQVRRAIALLAVGALVVPASASAQTAPIPGVGRPSHRSGESFTYTFDTAGTYVYVCTPHPWMIGEVQVT